MEPRSALSVKVKVLIAFLIVLSVLLALVFLVPGVVDTIRERLDFGMGDVSGYPDPGEIRADYSLRDSVERISGEDIVALSLEVAASGYKQPRTLIVMPVFSEQLLDAFPVVTLAGQEKAPILLTPYDELDGRIRDRIVSVRPQKIYLTGGLSDKVISDIRRINPRTDVEVLSGKDRWTLATEINSKLTNVKGAFVFAADAMKHALLIAPFAASHSYAIIPAKEDGYLPDGVTLPAENVYLIDGKMAVHDIPGATRLMGYNVFALNRSVLESLDYDLSNLVVLNSFDDFCVGLMVSPYAALRGAPIILSGSDGTFSGVSTAKKTEILAGACTLIGDQNKLSDSVPEGFELAFDIQTIMTKWEDWQPKFTSSANHAAQPYSLGPPYTLGSLSQEFVQDGLNMINFVRYIAGLPGDITEDAYYTQLSQSAAILLRYDFGHTPNRPAEMNQVFYQLALNGTSHSNIAKGFNTIADSIRNGYVHDSDTPASVALVGHRRWLLNPKMQKTGFGFVVDPTDSAQYTALYAQDQSRSSVPSYPWIAWPGNKVFPQQFFEPRDPWSISLNTDLYAIPRLNDVTVTLTEVSSNRTWTFSSANNAYTPNGRYFNVDTQPLGMSACLIFRPDNITVYKGKYHVSVAGLKDRQGQAAAIEYDVTFFDMNEYLRVTTLYDPTR
ncbi:MAG: cell wall-binding repeat-containing protein [Peptococcaceae bacterium]|nr:cell wall-binding repeat-containing protein [Peptococcaceae bacterium]